MLAEKKKNDGVKSDFFQAEIPAIIPVGCFLKVRKSLANDPISL